MNSSSSTSEYSTSSPLSSSSSFLHHYHTLMAINVGEGDDSSVDHPSVFTHFLISISQFVSFLKGNTEKVYLYGILGLFVGLISLMLVIICILKKKLNTIKSTYINNIHSIEVTNSKVNDHNANDDDDEEEEDDEQSKTISQKKAKEYPGNKKHKLLQCKSNSANKRRDYLETANAGIHNTSLHRAPSGGWTFHEGCHHKSSPQSVTSSPMFPGFGTNVFVHVESPNESPVLGSIPKQSSLAEQQQQLVHQQEMQQLRPIEQPQNEIQQYTIQQQQHIIMQHTSLHRIHSLQQVQLQAQTLCSHVQQPAQYKNPIQKANLKLLIPSAKVYEHSHSKRSSQHQQQLSIGQQGINSSGQQKTPQSHEHCNPDITNNISKFSPVAQSPLEAQQTNQNYLIPRSCHNKEKLWIPSKQEHPQNHKQPLAHQEKQHLQHQNISLQQYCNQPVPPASMVTAKTKYDDYYNMNHNNIVDNNNNNYINNDSGNSNSNSNDVNDDNNCDSDSIVWIRRSSIKLTADSEQHSSLQDPSSSFSPPSMTLPLNNQSNKRSPTSGFSSPISSMAAESNTPPGVPAHTADECHHDNVSITLKNNFHNVRQHLTMLKNSSKCAPFLAKDKTNTIKSVDVTPINTKFTSPVQYRILSHYPLIHSSKKGHNHPENDDADDADCDDNDDDDDDDGVC